MKVIKDRLDVNSFEKILNKAMDGMKEHFNADVSCRMIDKEIVSCDVKTSSKRFKHDIFEYTLVYYEDVEKNSHIEVRVDSNMHSHISELVYDPTKGETYIDYNALGVRNKDRLDPSYGRCAVRLNNGGINCVYPKKAMIRSIESNKIRT